MKQAGAIQRRVYPQGMETLCIFDHFLWKISEYTKTVSHLLSNSSGVYSTKGTHSNDPIRLMAENNHHNHQELRPKLGSPQGWSVTSPPGCSSWNLRRNKFIIPKRKGQNQTGIWQELLKNTHSSFNEIGTCCVPVVPVSQATLGGKLGDGKPTIPPQPAWFSGSSLWSAAVQRNCLGARSLQKVTTLGVLGWALRGAGAAATSSWSALRPGVQRPTVTCSAGHTKSLGTFQSLLVSQTSVTPSLTHSKLAKQHTPRILHMVSEVKIS